VSPGRPIVDCAHVNPVLRVRDLAAALAFYTQRLGFQPGFTWGEPPDFGGVDLDRVRVFLQQGEPLPSGATLAFMVDDADALFAYQHANGVQVLEPPGDRAYGIRDYSVRDLDGHTLVFGHALFNLGPPIPIERVDVPVRLEKRLAALLHELAAHKRMSLASCLEEILLHTNEPLGEGVASPHTRADLRFIQELKRKHGIDYDSHASYRFVEQPGPPPPEH
jgi:catechol 2,3-dioxygenase-like lactoylglutathione lyase family enzyme